MIKLKVPYKEKNAAKKLGAIWDAKSKTWCYNEKKAGAVGVLNFKKWLNLKRDAQYTIIKDGLFILESSNTCWSCKKETPVITLGYEIESTTEKKVPILITLRYLKYIQPNLYQYLKRNHATFRLDYSDTVKESYFMNHCEHCGSKLGDFFLHEDIKATFSPNSRNDFNKIKFKRIDRNYSQIVSGKYTISKNLCGFYAHLNPKIKDVFT